MQDTDSLPLQPRSSAETCLTEGKGLAVGTAAVIVWDLYQAVTPPYWRKRVCSELYCIVIFLYINRCYWCELNSKGKRQSCVEYNKLLSILHCNPSHTNSTWDLMFVRRGELTKPFVCLTARGECGRLCERHDFTSGTSHLPVPPRLYQHLAQKFSLVNGSEAIPVRYVICINTNTIILSLISCFYTTTSASSTSIIQNYKVFFIILVKNSYILPAFSSAFPAAPWSKNVIVMK